MEEDSRVLCALDRRKTVVQRTKNGLGCPLISAADAFTAFPHMGMAPPRPRRRISFFLWVGLAAALPARWSTAAPRTFPRGARAIGQGLERHRLQARELSWRPPSHLRRGPLVRLRRTRLLACKHHPTGRGVEQSGAGHLRMFLRQPLPVGAPIE